MKQTFKKPSYYLLSQAMDGDEKAIEKILAFYDPYISKCCLRPLYDEYGNVYIVVDMELKGLMLASGENNHSRSIENNQFQSNKNNQSKIRKRSQPSLGM